jgi:O-antigen biosynthesis protein WbqP
MKKRIFDLSATILFFPIIFLIILIVAVVLLIFEKKKIIYFSRRFGKNNVIFLMPKFRTMKLNSPDLPTHLFRDSNLYLTKTGKFLRKYSLDEFLQFFSVLKGEMSLVGPRPALHNQYDLIQMREKYNLHYLKPGITGLAQVFGRDKLSLKNKIRYENVYAKKKSIKLDVYIILVTLKNIFLSKNISH